ncbi:hypothetical protein OIU78_026596 [Salix suchowensis]|nr:hypothetical protein OIU78_026596 [Salix suchowensis]
MFVFFYLLYFLVMKTTSLLDCKPTESTRLQDRTSFEDHVNLIELQCSCCCCC